MTRVFRVAIPASQIGWSRRFYETVLGIEADETVPSRLYFHCDDVILAVIDWTVEPLGPFHSTPENLYLATDIAHRSPPKSSPAGRTRHPRHCTSIVPYRTPHDLGRHGP